MDPRFIAGPAGQVISAVRQKRQLDGYKDQLLIDTLDALSQQASHAAKAIVDEAEAILTKAAVCRLANNEEANSVHVRITEYFENHPRLTDLEGSLDVLVPLLKYLRNRADRLLQLPKTKKARRDKVDTFIASSKAMQDFARDLREEFQSLPARTGLARDALLRIDNVMMIEDSEARLGCKSERDAAVTDGRAVVQQSRLKRAEASLAQATVDARIAFL